MRGWPVSGRPISYPDTRLIASKVRSRGFLKSSLHSSEGPVPADFVEILFGSGVFWQAIALIFLDVEVPPTVSSYRGNHRPELGQLPEVLGGCCEGEFVLNAASIALQRICKANVARGAA